MYGIVHQRPEGHVKAGKSRRDALVRAMIEAAGSKGYRSIAVADVIAGAGSSRTTFYKNFDDKLDCFLAAYDEAAEHLLDAVAGRCEPSLPWTERVSAGLQGAIELFGEDPHLAQVVVVEIAAAGAEGQRRRGAMIGRLAGLLEKAPDPAHHPIPPNTAIMAVGSALGLFFDEIQAGRTAELPERLPDLLFAVLVPYVGPRAASAAGRRWAVLGSNQ
jgi:AcrR family transcriptional regulator